MSELVYDSASPCWSSFPYAWRFTDPRWDCLPPNVLSLVTPLAASDAAPLIQLAKGFREYQRVNATAYRVVSSVRLEGDDKVAPAQQWLRSELPESTRVYVSWGDSAAIAPREILVAYYDSFFYPFDTLDVFDDSADWAVLFGPEEWAVSIRRGGVPDTHADYDYLAGLDLVRCYPPQVQP